MTTLGTFQNGLNRQMVVLFRLVFDHSFTCAFIHLNKYYIITIIEIAIIKINRNCFIYKFVKLISITVVAYYQMNKKSYRILIPK